MEIFQTLFNSINIFKRKPIRILQNVGIALNTLFDSHDKQAVLISPILTKAGKGSGPENDAVLKPSFDFFVILFKMLHIREKQ
ncbi:hypothetical protein D3C73_1339020 [compost metagenome]